MDYSNTRYVNGRRTQNGNVRDPRDDYRRRPIEEREDKINRARNNSVSSRKKDIIDVKYRGSRFKISAHRLKVAVVTSFLATAIAATSIGIGLTSQIHKAQDAMVVREELKSYAQMVGEETHRTEKNDGYWYDTYDIAFRVLEDEDIHKALYGVYKDIGYNKQNKIEQTDDVITNMKKIVTYNQDTYGDKPVYDSFNDYLIKNNFVDKEGKPSTSVYEEKMNEYVLGQAKINNVLNETGIKK